MPDLGGVRVARVHVGQRCARVLRPRPRPRGPRRPCARRRVRIAAIGPGTARELVRRGLRPDLVPERFVAESLLAAFPDPTAASARVLLARAEQARDVLPEGLGARGYTVDVLPVYRTVPATPDAAAIARVQAGRSTR